MENLAEGLVGLVSGVLSGMFGVGGGFITTPLLRFFTDVPALIAVATPLVSMIPTTLVGAATHLRARNVDVNTALRVGVVGGVGAILGAQATRLVGGRVVLAVTGVVLIASAIEMLMRSGVSSTPADRESAVLDESQQAAPPRPTFAACAVSGLIAGAGSGFLGVGGGFILVPLFVGWFRFPMKRAIGTSLLSIAVISTPALISHILLGNIDFDLGLMLTIGAVPGGWIGARIALGSKESALRRGFALLMAFSGLLLAATEFGWL